MSDNSANVEVYILTYNRPNFIIETINSVLAQKYKNIEIIISDNSTNDKTLNVINQLELPSNLHYKKRSPSLPPIDHFNKIMDEVCLPYFIMFHDDDLMEPEMISKQLNIISKRPEVVSVGVNSYKLKNGRKSKNPFLSEKADCVIISDKEDLITRYLSKNKIAPFCGYMYRTNLVSNNRMILERGGKYCDVAFLITLLEKGCIYIINKKLMVLRMHSGQDSNKHSFLEFQKLLRFFLKTKSIKKNSKMIKNARIYNIYAEACLRLEKGDIRIFEKKWMKFILIFLHKSRLEFLLKFIIKSILKVFPYDFN